MKKLSLITTIVTILCGITAYADVCTDGNSYDMNECLISTMDSQQKALEADPNISANDLSDFISLRNKLCSQVSARYAGGTFEAINYGHCVISLNDWYMDQMRP